MTSPLSLRVGAALNATTSPTRQGQKPCETIDHTSTRYDSMGDMPSSPFVTLISNQQDRENIPPARPSSSDTEKKVPWSSKLLKNQAIVPTTVESPAWPRCQERSPRKLSSPEKRFPIKVRDSPPSSSLPQEQELALKRALQKNEELVDNTGAEGDDDAMIGNGQGTRYSDESTILAGGDAEQEGFADETTFSTFSAVPDMTMFAKIGHSPTKYAGTVQTPRGGVKDRSNDKPHPFIDGPRTDSCHYVENNNKQSDTGNTTNLILDFTEQFDSLSRYDHGHHSPSTKGRFPPGQKQSIPDLFVFAHSARTPSPKKNHRQPESSSSRMSNLLDFDIPPAPTPRSMPSITPRELESLKSGFLSEISSLRASLSGKEAEVLSLKTAVGDAEKRVGESLERVREERNLKEQLAMEREAWEKRGHEMEQVLRSVKQEIVHGEHEREALEGRLEESEKRREAAEMMAQEAESKMAGMRAGFSSKNDVAEEPNDQSGSTSRDVEIAVEKVARELHTLYKGKHETKVAALKRSYENRWDKKIKDLEAKLNELNKENEELKVGRDATMSSVIPRIPDSSDATEELRLRLAKDTKQVKELQARLEGLSEEMKVVKLDNSHLRQELEQERVEKGELVAACDELLSLQEHGPSNITAVTSGVENLRGSISRASGLRPPNFGHAASNTNGTHPSESRIGKAERGRSVPLQNRPGSGLGIRSGIMSSIEKMGSHKGRPE